MTKRKTRKKEVRPMEKRLLNLKETAFYTGYSVKTLSGTTAPGAKHPFPVKPFKVYGQKRWDIRDLDQWIEEAKRSQCSERQGA